jgi:hypothetical protein
MFFTAVKAVRELGLAQSPVEAALDRRSGCSVRKVTCIETGIDESCRHHDFEMEDP